MKIKLTPDNDIKVEKTKIGHVPILILRPKDKAPARVGLLWIHGGGYILGMKEMVYMGRALNLVKKFGVTVLSPGYRLAWLKPYPAAVEDCYTVLRYMDTHKEELGIDRLMVGGESAGGGLCAAVCMMARDQGIRVSFQMPLYPMISNFDTDSSRNNHGRVWNTRRNHLGWKLYLRADAKKNVSPYAAPSQQTDYTNLPPCYTFVGDGEPFRDETLKYVDDLRRAGIKADVDVYHTNIHAFDMLYPENDQSIKAIKKFELCFVEAIEKAM